MFRNLLKKKNFQPKLGRWVVTYEPKVLDKRINWANHDHCGSEICEKYFVKENDKKKETKKTVKMEEGKEFYYMTYCL